MRAESYPKEYKRLFEQALALPTCLQFKKKSAAVSFRVELYKYRYAVRDELPKQKEYYEKIMNIRMSIKDKVLTLTIKKAKFVEKLNDH